MFVLLSSFALANVQEFKLQTTLSTLGIESGVQISDTVTVDYIMKGVESDYDVAAHSMLIFLAAAKIAPDSDVIVLKGRYNQEGLIEPDEFWTFVSVIEEDVIEEFDTSSGLGGFFFLLILAGLGYWVYKKIKK